MSAAVLHHGEVILARGFRHADLERRIPAAPGTPYDIASVAKPLSAVLALRRTGSGAIDLDRPMAAYSEWADFCREFSEQPTVFAEGLRCDRPEHTFAIS